MLVSIHVDNTLPLPVEAFCQTLSRASRSITFRPGIVAFRLEGESISYPQTYKKLPKSFYKSIEGDDRAIIGSSVPYDNNWFFEGAGRLIIVSFSGWNLLTSLPVTNGLAYFVAALLGGQWRGDAMQ